MGLNDPFFKIKTVQYFYDMLNYILKDPTVSPLSRSLHYRNWVLMYKKAVSHFSLMYRVMSPCVCVVSNCSEVTADCNLSVHTLLTFCPRLWSVGACVCVWGQI